MWNKWISVNSFYYFGNQFIHVLVIHICHYARYCLIKCIFIVDIIVLKQRPINRCCALVNSVVLPVSVFGTLCLLRAEFVHSQHHRHNHNSIGSSPMESVEEFMYWCPYCAVERLVHSGKIEHVAGPHVTFRCTAFYSWHSNITPMI